MLRKNKYFLCTELIIVLVILSCSVIAQSAYGSPIKKEGLEISRDTIEREITTGELLPESLIIKNLKNANIKFNVIPSQTVNEILQIEKEGYLVFPNNSTTVNILLIGKKEGKYDGELQITGDINEKIRVNITIKNKTSNIPFFVNAKPTKNSFKIGEAIEITLDIQKATREAIENLSIVYLIKNKFNNESIQINQEQTSIYGSTIARKMLSPPENLSEGEYIIEVSTTLNNETDSSYAEVSINTPIMYVKLFNILPIWLALVILGSLITAILIFIFIRRTIEKNKKYKMQLYVNTLPKKEENSILMGKIAELNRPAYLNLNNLTTHAVVAGATGGGKSISAQVIIEEALLKNIAVIVFDPTAQWSGMLRKNEDKKMMSFYPNFGLKATDARAFPGSVRQIKNARQVVDIKKHMNPGQIQIFTLNKLDPSEMDTFVASIIASIFRSGPEEYPGLRLLLVFDEVHRLLPKFGGSGKGFLQIERACREFRKWGFGVMLVSQVLSDFVGEIKANINTEVQMRTRDEGDLNRIKTKYGEEFLQSLIKASVGVGMFVNPAYNKGKPYFVGFRPILHNTRRLSDEILDKYNSYNEIIDDLEYQIEQLEEMKIDVFDLKMELKLVKDKLMTGNFSVVDIYLEGLKPRLEKQWQKIGKKPKKLELELVDTTAIEKSISEAKKGRTDWDKDNKESKK